MKRAILLIILVSFPIVYTGCAGQPKAELDYEQTKKMMIDILQTDDGKKVLTEMIADDKLKQHLIIESDVVKETLSDTLLSKEGKKMWEELFEDPDFVKNFHNSVAEEQKKLFKQLMSDAEFQKQMMELLQDPEMGEQMIKLLKSQQYRDFLEKTIIETADNPLFRAKFEKSLIEKLEKDLGGGKEDEKKKSDKDK